MNIESVVRERYARGAKQVEPSLCCPVGYDPKYLEVIPKEILEKDYGCGDPSRYVREGDHVLDLGSGAGKICFIASQIVGPKGKVVGIDFNPAMLELARKYQKTVGDKIGWHNVEFCKGEIQNLDLDNESVDLILSNCVLNLVRPEDKRKLFFEMHRVLKRDGRVAISDIVSDQPIPDKLKQDPELWSGCISGAFEEEEFLKAFQAAGFCDIQVKKRDSKPWRVIDGIEFRSLTVTACKESESTNRDELFVIQDEKGGCCS